MANGESRRILIVEDEEEQRRNLAEYFKNGGWDVIWAANGADALTVLRGNDFNCECIVLDQRMPVMGGKEFLEKLHDLIPGRRIPVILLSAYLEPGDFQKRYTGKTVAVLGKPQDPELIEALADSLRSGRIEKGFAQRLKNMQEIDEATRSRELALATYYNKTVGQGRHSLCQETREPLFIVARRWNSWYPSFFDIPGGCYALVNPICEERRRHRVAVIDPGFRFLKVLADLGISVKDIETCIITHNHPDHLGGIFEYIASRNAAKEKIRLICNPTTFAMFSTCCQDGLEVMNLNGGRQPLMSYRDCDGNGREIVLESFRTEHHEIGYSNEPKGLIVGFPLKEPERRVVILGDTAYETGRHREEYRRHITDSRTKVVVLHVGSAQLKERIGGHLYLRGLNRLLASIGEELASVPRPKNDKLLVIVSEWGLEHATRQQVLEICPGIEGFDNSSPLLDTIDFVRSGLANLEYDDRMIVVPGDIGLMVGMETGTVHWVDGGNLQSCPPEKLRWRIRDAGLEYYMP